MLYFAYGMNTEREGMARRCPGAHSLGAARLRDHAFRFAIHADVLPCEQSWVDGVLWVVDQCCLDVLDTVEGYPWYYDRVIATVDYMGREVQAQCYRMQPGHEDALPADYYLDSVVRGYQQHQVPTDQIYNCLEILRI